MTETEFLQRAEATLRAVEEAVDAADLDVELTRAGNVLTLELADGARIVINSQAPMQQLWLAAKSGAHHFALAADDRWRDTRDDGEFFATLSRVVSALGGVPVVLADTGR
jgi:CyaY protein